MHNADLIIAIGARFDDRITNTPKLFAPNAKIIHFDVDQSSVSKIIEANIAVFGQVKDSLQEILNELESRRNEIDEKNTLLQDKLGSMFRTSLSLTWKINSDWDLFFRNNIYFGRKYR